MAVETNYFPSWEMEKGKWRLTYQVKNPRSMGRFSHLQKEEYEEFQEMVDSRLRVIQGHIRMSEAFHQGGYGEVVKSCVALSPAFPSSVSMGKPHLHKFYNKSSYTNLYSKVRPSLPPGKVSKWRWTARAERLLSLCSIASESGQKALLEVPSTVLAGLRIPPIISVLRTISRISNRSMRSALSGSMGFIVPICGPSSTAIWAVGFYVTVSPGSDVRSAVMNIFWLFLASIVTSVLPVTRSGALSSENGFAGRF
jgi:hypothetical protein